ncbi:MAG: single-stranded-DNA-specific exonuclease RecJ [Paenibacillaceae bacterium]
MLKSYARWSIPKVDTTAVEQLSQQLNITPLLASLLTVRGLHEVEEARRFLFGKKDLFHDPFLLNGMQQAVARIQFALKNKEKIRIYGDYDADGVSSTSLMIVLMRQLNADFDYYIPNRQTEGYGLNRNSIELARKQDIKLIITVDTGISAVDEISYAREQGIEIIVTDHHEPPDILPDAYAVINPKKPGCSYPFKQLAGVGVAFKLAEAMLGRFPEELLEFVTIGTIADLMPLVDENRIFVRMGIERLRTNSSLGMRALLGVSGIDQKDLNAGHIGFSIAPRINASGRLDHAGIAVTCLTTSSEQEAEHIAFDLDRLNRERQQIVELISAEAIEQAERLQELGLMEKVLVLAGEGWNVGVVGIVASKVLERYYRPTLILSIDPVTGLAKGSARSIAGFDIHAALTDCSHLLEHYGGHQAAAGMALHRDRLIDFHRSLNDYAEQHLTEDLLIPELMGDMEIESTDISVDMISQLELLAPYGMKNPSPRFVLNGLLLKEIKIMGKDQQHVKLLLCNPLDANMMTMEALAFGKSNWAPLISTNDQIDIMGELSVNEWNGTRRPQIIIKDIRILEKQVFDWRGKKLSDSVVTQWMEGFSSAMQDGGKKAILLFREEEWNQFDIDLIAHKEIAVWLINELDSLLPMNDMAKVTHPEEVGDLLLFSLPPDLARLEWVLPLFFQANRVYSMLQDSVAHMSGPMPTREQFIQVYRLLMRDNVIDISMLGNAVKKHTGLTSSSFLFILTVFEELLFLAREGSQVHVRMTPAKMELHESRSYQEKLHREEVERELIYSNAKELKDWILQRVQQLQRKRMLPM